jgi:outer membrane protein OmpA-like peptidoglycan-associated protein/outer membrane protein W
MLFRNRLLIHVALVAAAVLPTNAMAVEGDWLDHGDWLLRVGVHQLNPDKSNLPNVFGGDLVFDKGEALSIDAEYMFGDHLGADLFVPTYFSLDLQRRPGVGGTSEVSRIGETDLWTPIVGLNWHFNPDGAIRPYIGVGAAWANFSGEEVFAPGVPANSRLEIDEAFGPAGRIGVDIGTNEHWFLNFDVRYVELDTDIEVEVPAGISTSTVPLGEATIDPWIYGIAVGYRFGAEKPLPVPVEEEPPPPPPPPPPEKCPDGDADGVCDADDKCPNTAAGTPVDRVGCPLSQTLKLLFDFDSAELRPESINELERLVKFMNEVPFATALIEGHTDSVGADAYNLALSDRRAKSVFDYLTSRGVDPARLKSVGKGESEPVADNATEEGRQENRRVMLIRTDTGT